MIDRRRASRLVARVEDASAQERDAERAEQRVADHHDRTDGRALVRRQHLPFHHEVVGHLQQVRRQADGQADGPDARAPPRAVCTSAS